MLVRKRTPSQLKSNPDPSGLAWERGNLRVGLNLVALTPVGGATPLYRVSCRLRPAPWGSHSLLGFWQAGL